MDNYWQEQRNQIIGLGENSFKKSYYPELQTKISELENSYKNLQTIFNSIDDGIVIHDEFGKIMDLNTKAQQLFNISEEEKDIFNISDLTSKSFNYTNLLTIWQDVLNGTPKVIDWTVAKAKTKDEIIVQISINRVFLYGRYVLVGVLRDFSERIKFEKELIKAKEKSQESEERLKTYINSIPDIICYKDGQGKWLLANDADLELFCLKNVDYFGKTDLDLAEYTADIYREIFKNYMDTDEQAWNKKIISKGIEIIPTVKGENKVFDVYKVPVFHATGERKGLAVIGREITELHKTQQNLTTAKLKAEENELKYRVYFEQLLDGIVIINTETTSFIEFNDQVCRQLGYSRNEFSKLTIFDIEAKETIEETKQKIKMVLETGRADFETKQLTKQGQIRDIFVSARIIEINGEKVYHCIWRDITDLRKFEKELIQAKERAEKSENHLKTLINTIPDLIWLKDTNGVYLNCNYRFEDFFGAKESEIIGKTDYDFKSKEIGDFFRAHDSKAMKAGKPVINEEEITFAGDGHKELLETIKMPLYNKKNEILGVLGIGRDITQRKKIESELIQAKVKIEESENLLQIITNNVPAFLSALDMKSLKYIFANSKFANSYNLTKEQILGKYIWEILGEENYEFAKKYIDQVKKGNSTTYINTFNLVAGKRYLLVNYVPWFNDEGEIDKFIVLASDITEQKKISDDLKKSEEKYRNLFNNAQVGMYRTRLDGSEILDFNDYYLQIFEKKREEMIHHPSVIQWADQKEREIFKAQLTSTGQVDEFDAKMLTKSGKIKNCLTSARLYNDIIEGTIIDITERIQSELELKIAKDTAEENEEYFRSIFQETPVLLWEEDYSQVSFYLDELMQNGITDFDEYFNHHPKEIETCSKKIIITDVNQTVLNTFQYPDKESLIENFEKTLTPVSIKALQAALVSLAKNEQNFECLTENKTKYGETKHFFLKSFVLKRDLKNRTRMIIAMIDITKLKHQEQELIIAKEKAEDSEKKYRYILENAPIGIFQRNLDDSKYSVCNEALAHQFKFNTVEDFLKNNTTKNSGWKDLNEYEKFSKTLLQQKQVEDYEFESELHDGSPHWTSIFVKLLEQTNNVIGFTIDITEKKLAQIAFKESEERYKLLVDTMMYPVIVTTLEGEILFANKQALNFFGLEENIICIENIKKFWVESEMKNRFFEILQSEGIVKNMEVKAFRKNSIATILLSATIINFYGKRAILSLFNDITKQKELEQQIFSIAIDTEEKERLRFAQEMHDGLAPLLSAAKMYLQWVQQTNNPTEMPEYINKALELIDDSYKTTREISHMLSPHVLQNYGLLTALKNITEKIEGTKINKINIRYSSNEFTDCFSEYSIQKQTIIYRVLLECINNTLKHAKATEININFVKNKESNEMYINYSDNGIGFDSDLIQYHSKGLGLLNMKNRIEWINGIVNIYSKPNEGVDIKIFVKP